MSQQDLATKQGLDVAVAGLRTELPLATLKTQGNPQNQSSLNRKRQTASERRPAEAIVMSQQDLVTKQDLDVAVAGLRTELP